MKYQELQQKSDKELKELLKTLKTRSVELRFNVLGGNAKDIQEMRTSKKTIAKILTLLSQRKRGVALQEQE